MLQGARRAVSAGEGVYIRLTYPASCLLLAAAAVSCRLALCVGPPSRWDDQISRARPRADRGSCGPMGQRACMCAGAREPPRAVSCLRAGGDWAIEGGEAARGARRKGGRLCTTVCSSALTRTRAIQLGEDEPTWERRWAMRRLWRTYMGAYLTDRSPGAAYTYSREGRVRAQE